MLEPTTLHFYSPLIKNRVSGMPAISGAIETSLTSSTSTDTKRTFVNSPASYSSYGASWTHGPHQVAPNLTTIILSPEFLITSEIEMSS